jgi:hypothetical protein
MFALRRPTIAIAGASKFPTGRGGQDWTHGTVDEFAYEQASCFNAFPLGSPTR